MPGEQGIGTGTPPAALWLLPGTGSAVQGQSLSCCRREELHSLHHRDLHHEHLVPTLFFAHFVGSSCSSCRHTRWINIIFFHLKQNKHYVLSPLSPPLSLSLRWDFLNSHGFHIFINHVGWSKLCLNHHLEK